jgi:hypothetical protein
MWLKDKYMERVPVGTIVFPSASARKNPRGGGYEDAVTSRPLNDKDVFPALVISIDHQKRSVKVLGPSGLHEISKYCLVSVEASQ